jgi:hypothetical protein
MFSCTNRHHHQLLPRLRMHCLLVLLARHLLLGHLGPHHQHHPQGTCAKTNSGNGRQTSAKNHQQINR